MKVSAIVFAMLLSAASMWAQAIVGYAGATAASGTAAAGSASKLGDSGMGGLHRKMSSAMGEISATSGSQNTVTHVHSAAADTGMQSGMHCKEMKSGAHAMSGKQCKEMQGTNMQGMKAACCRRNKDGKMAHEMDCCKHGKCAHEKSAAGKEGTANSPAPEGATGAKESREQEQKKQEQKITFVGAKK